MGELLRPPEGRSKAVGRLSADATLAKVPLTVLSFDLRIFAVFRQFVALLQSMNWLGTEKPGIGFPNLTNTTIVEGTVPQTLWEELTAKTLVGSFVPPQTLRHSSNP